MKIDSVQVDILATNKVNVTRGEWGVRGPGAGVQPAPILRLASLFPALYRSGLFYSNRSFYFGSHDQDVDLPHFQGDMEGKE